MRSDENLARPSFRYSPEWKRTHGMEQLAPQIDARLAGVEKRGDELVVHSLSGNERNHYFVNRGGRSFLDISALSGMDTPADSRGFAVLDYDRDGWQDVALVNANQPLFNLYHNEMPAAGHSGGVIALRFVGGNKTPSAAEGVSCRDGFGARVTADLGDSKLLREHRCGDGFAAQHTATMLLGIGSRATAKTISVRWPSGAITSTDEVPEGTLLTAYERATDAPSGETFVRSTYRLPMGPPPAPAPKRPTFPLASADPNAAPAARLRVYTTMATWCAACKTHLPKLRRLADELTAEGLEVVAVPIDEEDDDAKLSAYVEEMRPPYRLLSLSADERAQAKAAFKDTLGEEPPLPCSVVTNSSGRVLTALPGVPVVSALRKMLSTMPAPLAAQSARPAAGAPDGE